jgi:hypothetical protein
MLALAAAGCGSAASQASPAWSFAAAPSASAASTPASSQDGATTPAPIASETASASLPRGLAATCAAQWAASVSTYENGYAGVITAVLLPKSGTGAPAVEPTAATLQTDQGPIPLTVAMVSSDENDTLWGTTRLDLGLPVLKAGTYRAEFLDLADPSGTWRFRVGEVVVRVEPGSAPGDLERAGGSIEAAQADGGSVTGFEISLRNTTSKPIEVTGASTDIPGLPVKWVLVARDPNRVVPSVTIPAGQLVKVEVGTESTAQPVSFVLATPDLAYRVGGSPERRALFDPILFESGFGQPSDVAAYGSTLPADACAQQP